MIMMIIINVITLYYNIPDSMYAIEYIIEGRLHHTK